MSTEAPAPQTPVTVSASDQPGTPAAPESVSPSSPTSTPVPTSAPPVPTSAPVAPVHIAAVVPVAQVAPIELAMRSPVSIEPASLPAAASIDAAAAVPASPGAVVASPETPVAPLGQAAPVTPVTPVTLARYAGFWRRAIAGTIDVVLLAVLGGLGAWAAREYIPFLVFDLDLPVISSSPVEVVVPVIPLVLFLIYWVLLESMPLQATFGKLLAGSKVTTIKGGRVSLRRNLWRFAFQVLLPASAVVAYTVFTMPEVALGISAVFVLGYLLAAVTPRKQTLHDLLSATVVVRRGAASTQAAGMAAVATALASPAAGVPPSPATAGLAALPASEPPVAKQPTPKPAKKRPGILRLGCTGVLGLLVLVIALGVSAYFGLPRRLGLVSTPAERLLSGPPDRQTAASLVEDMKRSGVATTGMELYVLPITGTQESIAYAMLDASQGF